MSLAAKKKRRRLLLLLIIVGTAMLGGGAYVGRKLYLRHVDATLREEGLAAARAGRAAEAVEKLEKCYRRYQRDPEFLVEYIKVRDAVPLPQNQHVLAKAHALRSLLDVQPDRIEELRQLLRCYLMIPGHSMHASNTADKILDRSPNDLEALELKYAILPQNKPQERLAMAERWSAAAPRRLVVHRTVLELMKQVGQSADAILARAKQYPTKEKPEPTDPRAMLLLADGHLLVGQQDAAKTVLAQAARQAIPDENFVGELLGAMERAGMVNESLALLRQAPQATEAPALQRRLAVRLWTAELYKELVQRLGDFDAAKAAKIDGELLAMWADALRRLGDKAGAEQIVNHMRQRKDDPVAMAWVAVQDQAANPAEADPRQTLALCEAAQKESLSPYIESFIGDTYQLMGEVELAMGHWNQAAWADRTWGTPLLRIAEVLIGQGVLPEAEQLMREAVSRAPEGRQARAMRVLVWSRLGLRGTDDQTKWMTEEARKLRAQYPEDDLTHVLLAEAYAARGEKPQARAAYQKLADEFQSGEFFGAGAYRLGESLFEDGRYDLALRNFEAAIGNSSEQEVRLSARYQSARCLDRLGRPSEAAPIFREVAGAEGANPFRDYARMALADSLAGSGEKQEPLAIYSEISTGKNPPQMRAEAMVKGAALAAELGDPARSARMLESARAMEDAGAWRGAAVLGRLRLAASGKGASAVVSPEDLDLLRGEALA